MKNLSKKQLFIGTVALLGVTLSVWAAITTTIYSPANGKTSANLGPVSVSGLTLINTNTALTSTVYVYDAPGTNLTYVIPSYSNLVTSIGYVTNSWTNYFGIVNSNVFLATLTTTSSVPQSTNWYPLVGSFVVNSNASSSGGILAIPLTYNFKYGVTVTNDRSVSTVIQYSY